MRIAVFSIDPVIGEALACLLTHTGGFQVVACLSSLGSANAMLESQSPDLLLFTEDFDDEAGRIVVSKLRQSLGVPTMLTHARVTNDAGNGPFDFVQSRWPGVGALCQAIRSIGTARAPSEAPIAPKRGRPAGSRNKTSSDGPPQKRDLSKRLSEFSRLVGQGKDNREIAQIMGIAESTAKLYVSKLLKQHGLSNRVQLALKISATADSKELATSRA